MIISEQNITKQNISLKLIQFLIYNGLYIAKLYIYLKSVAFHGIFFMAYFLRI